MRTLLLTCSALCAACPAFGQDVSTGKTVKPRSVSEIPIRVLTAEETDGLILISDGVIVTATRVAEPEADYAGFRSLSASMALCMALPVAIAEVRQKNRPE